LLDLDGVVYIGDQAVKHAAQSIEAARVQGMRVAFVTNNASRTPETVADRLSGLGVPAQPSDVITSSMAVARMLHERLRAGSRVLVVGGEGLRTAVAGAGFSIIDDAEHEPAAVVQGYTPATTWTDLAEATIAVNRGVLWIAANMDATMPSPRGPVPGNGALVGAVITATGRHPLVAGKPEPPLHAEAVRRSGAQRPLVVGDRLDSDIEGAIRVGADSLLVLTGVTDPRRVLQAAPHERPSYVSRDLRGLLTPHPDVVASDASVRCGSWEVRRKGTVLSLAPASEPASGADHDDLDALRALAVAAWQQPDWSDLDGEQGVLDRLGLTG
jgi:HAD superfamily hydrolase (TIGR01450 family)